MVPPLPDFQILAIDIVDDGYRIMARATAPTAVCPDCAEFSSSVHSKYERAPADLPSFGLTVRLCLQVRRFFCRNIMCGRKIFCERLPQLVNVYARRTVRLARALTLLAFGLGGEFGQRLVKLLGMPASRDTLLRLIRQQPLPSIGTPQIIGVDDWAFRKGHNYGTIICDLKQGKVIDLLPDREAETLTNWLQEFSTVELITRDRSKAYAEGASLGAPQAIQVADRWHLINNLVDALEASLARHPSRLQGATIADKSTNARQIASEGQTTAESDRLLAREAKRAMRKRQYEQVVLLRQRGVRLAEIAAQAHISTGTVKRWLAHSSFPEQKPRAVQPTVFDPFRAYAIQRLQEGCHNLAQIYREIDQQGYAGTYSTLYQHCRNLQVNQKGELSSLLLTNNLEQPKRHYSPRQAAFLFIRRPEELSDEQQADLDVMLGEHSQFRRWYELVQQFMALMRQRDLVALDAWLIAVEETGSGSMKRFVSGLRSNYAEVAAALSYKWSNGPVEGHVNRLKMVKRQMFGRANFDLLRQRVLYRI
jgi:transposase